MILREFLDGGGLIPQVEGITGLLDGEGRDSLLDRMPSNKLETRLQNALMETLYPLVELGNVALSFTYPTEAFLIETTTKAEIVLALERALAYVAVEHRAGLRNEYGASLGLIREGNGKPMRFE